MWLTWLLAGGFVVLLLAGLVYAWRNRPARNPDDPDGEQAYLAGFNIANAKDFGFYERPRGDDA